MTALPLDHHPVVVCVDALEAALDQVSTEVWAGLDPTTVRGLVARLSRVEARVVAQKMAAARALDQTSAARDERTGGTPSSGSLGHASTPAELVEAASRSAGG